MRSQPSRLHIYHRLGFGAEIVLAIWCLFRQFGCVLQQWGVEQSTIEMVNGLHSKAWFQVPGHNEKCMTTTGGRQGCVLGGLVFNAAFSVAMAIVRFMLTEMGCDTVLPGCGNACWSAPGPEVITKSESIIDTAFVDDTVYMFSTKPAVKLLEKR